MIAFLLGFALSGFKVSAGFVVVIGVGFGGLMALLFKRDIKLFVFSAVVGLSNLIIFKSLTHGGQSFIIFEPWWFIRNLIVGGDRLDWKDLELRRQYYLSVGGVRGYLRVLEYELIGFFLYLFGNIGMRFLGFIELSKKVFLIRKIGKSGFFVDPFESALIIAMLTAFIVPLLFIQRGITYNINQFTQYFMLIIGFYAAISTVYMLDKIKFKIAKIILACIIILLSLPTVIGNLNEFYGPGKAPLAVISNKEIEAIDYLKGKSGKEDIVLNYPYNKYLRDQFNKLPLPIYAWYSTSYISALSGRPTYLSAEEQVDITGYPVEERRKTVEDFFTNPNSEDSQKFLEDNNIKFIYLPKKESGQNLDRQNTNIKKVFENDEVNVYQVI